MIRIDRVGRGLAIESQLVLYELSKLGVSIFTRETGFVTLDTPMAEMFSYMQSVVASQENRVRKDKAKEVYRRKRAAGEVIGNRRPYGLLRDKNGKDVPDGKRAAAIREAFRMRVSGFGYYAIAQRLAAIAPPCEFKNGRSRIIRWTPSRTMQVFTTKAYSGTVIDEATFARAQRTAALLTSAERNSDLRRRWPWPLSGSIRCYCGRAMTGICTGQGNSRIRYYGCRAFWNHDSKVRLVRAEILEERFVALLDKLRATPSLIERYRRRADAPISTKQLESASRELKSQVADVERKRELAWELHAAGRVRNEDVQVRLDKLNQQRDDLQRRIAELSEQIALAKAAASRRVDADALLRRASKTFKSASEPEQRLISRAVALELGGLYVAPDQQLKIGRVTEEPPGPAPLRRAARSAEKRV